MEHLQKVAVGLLMILAFACNSNDETPGPVLSDSEYFPLQKGRYQIYDVHETVYTLGNPETYIYEIKTVVSDSFSNSTGNYTYVIHRSKRNDASQEWQALDTWSVRADQEELIVTEGNISYVVLNFPVGKGNEWDGNAYNNLLNPPSSEENEDLYMIDLAGEPYTVNDETFDDCVVVIQEDEPERIVFYDTRLEVYARNVGVIYKEKTQLSYCAQPECLGQEKIESGVIFKQTIKQYGKE